MTDAEQDPKPSPDDAQAEPTEEPDAEPRQKPEGPDSREGDADEQRADAEEPETEAEQPRPKKRRKKKRKKQRAVEEPALRPARDAQGRDRPAFLRAFPHDPELDRLVEAYEAGDYATVRREAPELAERTEDSAVRDAAWELRRRIDPDPLARYLLLTGIALLVFLVVWVYATTQGH